MSMMERKPWTQRRNRRPPLRFRDVLPQSLPALPPAHIAESLVVQPQSPPTQQIVGDISPSLAARVGFGLRRIFTTTRNAFGLSRRYQAEGLPAYDPEQDVTPHDLSRGIPAHAGPSEFASQGFYPYPNLASFLLGDWYWNGGVQKSQESFERLTGIICDPEFKAADIKNVKWNSINKELAADDSQEWLDEDAGWTRTPVTISVPYQPRRGVPSEPDGGPRSYLVGDLYHRGLVSVIREKLSSLSEPHHFHFEPYELLWQSTKHQAPILVQGELYTSPAFINAHRELQESPTEPGCDLPRVIVALMFWSDTTHLTSFGNAKLWPLYLFFGNESKYRRCKPSLHLCEHIAYFQKVSFSDIAFLCSDSVDRHSSRMPSRISLLLRLRAGKPQVQHSWLIASASLRTNNGKYSLMMTSSKLGSMASWYAVATASHAGFIPGYLLTLRITRKSEFVSYQDCASSLNAHSATES